MQTKAHLYFLYLPLPYYHILPHGQINMTHTSLSFFCAYHTQILILCQVFIAYQKKPQMFQTLCHLPFQYYSLLKLTFSSTPFLPVSVSSFKTVSDALLSLTFLPSTFPSISASVYVSSILSFRLHPHHSTIWYYLRHLSLPLLIDS